MYNQLHPVLLCTVSFILCCCVQSVASCAALYSQLHPVLLCTVSCTLCCFVQLVSFCAAVYSQLHPVLLCTVITETWFNFVMSSLDSSVGIVTRLWAGWSGV